MEALAEAGDLTLIKEQIAYHLERTTAVASEIPTRMPLGLYDVNCVQVRELLVNKHHMVFEALLELVASLAREKCKVRGPPCDVRREGRGEDNPLQR